MVFQIEHRRFVEAGGATRPGADAESAVIADAGAGRTWTSHAIFIDAADPDAMRKRIEQRAFRYVELLASPSPSGVWMLGGRYWLELAQTALLREPVKNA